jgi:hypothetical protein
MVTGREEREREDRARDRALKAELLELMTQYPEATQAIAERHRQVDGRCDYCKSPTMDCQVGPVAKQALRLARSRGWQG